MKNCYRPSLKPPKSACTRADSTKWASIFIVNSSSRRSASLVSIPVSRETSRRRRRGFNTLIAIISALCLALPFQTPSPCRGGYDAVAKRLRHQSRISAARADWIHDLSSQMKKKITNGGNPPYRGAMLDSNVCRSSASPRLPETPSLLRVSSATNTGLSSARLSETRRSHLPDL